MNPVNHEYSSKKCNQKNMYNNNISESSLLPPTMHNKQKQQQRSIHLIAAALEEELHNIQKYRNARDNVMSILALNQNYHNYHSTKTTRIERNKYQIMYGFDATKLEKIFSINNQLFFNRVIFNFPHWVGKS